MAVEKILATDSLNDGRVKLNAAIEQSNEAITKATTADENASQAVTTANSVQEQFNQVVIEGDSSVEAAQARVSSTGITYTTLKERLDQEHESVTTQLAETEQELQQKATYLKKHYLEDDYILIVTYLKGFQYPKLYMSRDGFTFHKIADIHEALDHKAFDYAPIYRNGYFYIFYDWTDVNFNEWEIYDSQYKVGGNRVGVIKTSDFINFDTFQINIPTQYKATWAPEPFIDTNGKVFMFITMSDCTEASSSKDGTTSWKKYLYYMEATDDTLQNWTNPTRLPLTDNAGTDVSNKIDPFIYYENSEYHLFIKQENDFYIQHYKSNNLLYGYTLVKEFTDNGVPYSLEAPGLVKYKGKYYLYANANADDYYTVFVSDDLEKWSSPTKLIVDDNVDIFHFTPFLVSNTDIKNIIANKIKYIGSNPFVDNVSVKNDKQSDIVNIIQLNGTYNRLLLTPNTVYRLMAGSNATINSVDTSLMKLGDKCYFDLATTNPLYSLIFKFISGSNLTWDTQNDLIINPTSHGGRVLEVVTVADGICHFNGLIPSVKSYTVNDSSLGLKVDAKRQGNLVTARISGALAKALTKNVIYTFANNLPTEIIPLLTTGNSYHWFNANGDLFYVAKVFADTGKIEIHASENINSGTFFEVSLTYMTA